MAHMYAITCMCKHDTVSWYNTGKNAHAGTHTMRTGTRRQHKIGIKGVQRVSQGYDQTMYQLVIQLAKACILTKP